MKIVVIAGDGAINDIRRQVAVVPVVEVRDEYDRRLPNVRVVFTVPATGAGAVFADGRKEFIATTDEQGRAVARGLRPNAIEGRFPIRVTASGDGRQGSAVIWQSNTTASREAAGPGGGGKKKLLLLGLIGGAAAGIAIGVTHGGGSSSATTAAPPTTLSPGTVTVGGPR